MRRPILLLLAVLALALWGCNGDTPTGSADHETAAYVPPAPAGDSGFVIDHHELTDKINPLGGVVNTLVILANYYDTPANALLTESSRQTIDGFMFSTQGDGYSVDELYRAMSDDQTGITGQVVGPYTIAGSITDLCTFQVWGEEAYAAAELAGIDMSQYAVFVFVYPNGNHCDIVNQWGGVAYDGNKNGIFKWQGISNYSHELGHLYGMNHSGTPEGGAYGDLSCMMASSWGFDQWLPLHEVNAVWKYRANWFDEGEILTIDAPGTYTVYLAPTERDPAAITDPPGQDACQLLLIDTSGLLSPQPLHYVSYRRAEGYDAAPILGSLMGRTHVHTKPDWNSSRLAMLEADDVYETDQFRITAVTDGLNGEEWVELTVEVFESNCDNCFDADFGPVYVYSSTQPKYFASGWSLSVTNWNDTLCGAGTYDVTGYCQNPDLEFAGPSAMLVAPGATGSAQVLLQPLATLSEGIHGFTLQVSEAGECPDVMNFTGYYVLDATAPTAPAGCAAIMTLNESAIVSWNASTDATAGVDRYEVWCNDSLVGTSTTLSFEHEGVYFNYRYTYEVRAIDKAGNVSGWSNAVTIGCRKCPIPQES